MRVEDVESLASYQSDSAYLRHYSEPPDAHAIVAAAMEWAREEPRTNFQFAVVRKLTEAVIGCAGIRMRGHAVGEAQIGIEIDPSCWRRGFAREALSALIEFAVSNLMVDTIWAYTAHSNCAAQTLVKEFGFVEYAEEGDIVQLRLRLSE